MKIARSAAALALLLLVSACSRPLLLNNGVFLHTVEPLTINREPTGIDSDGKVVRGWIHQIQHPVSGVVSVRVGKNGLGDVAKKHGIKTIYYADIERWSAFFGLWSSEVVHIYGR